MLKIYQRLSVDAAGDLRLGGNDMVIDVEVDGNARHDVRFGACFDIASYKFPDVARQFICGQTNGDRMH